MTAARGRTARQRTTKRDSHSRLRLRQIALHHALCGKVGCPGPGEPQTRGISGRSAVVLATTTVQSLAVSVFSVQQVYADCVYRGNWPCGSTRFPLQG